jgi:hypothetical protein
MLISVWVDIEENVPLNPDVVADMISEFVTEQFNPASVDVEYMLTEETDGNHDDATGFYSRRSD